MALRGVSGIWVGWKIVWGTVVERRWGGGIKEAPALLFFINLVRDLCCGSRDARSWLKKGRGV